jgi:dienelactone hydrolase
MGLRLRLKASVPITGYTAASQVIMTAMKTYGLIVADNGSDWYFQGDSDDAWTAKAPDGKGKLINEIVGDFHGLTGADFEAVYTGDPVATGL